MINRIPSIDQKSAGLELLDVVRTIGIFALFSFVFHFAWEILQVPLFMKMPAASHWQGTLICLKATFGDVGIALASFAVAAFWQKDWRWFLSPTNGALAGYLATGVLITIAFEWHAVYWAGRWSYSALMPIVPVLRVGAAPVMQWIVIPLVVLFFLQRHDSRTPKRLG